MVPGCWSRISRYCRTSSPYAGPAGAALAIAGLAPYAEVSVNFVAPFPLNVELCTLNLVYVPPEERRQAGLSRLVAGLGDGPLDRRRVAHDHRGGAGTGQGGVEQVARQHRPVRRARQHDHARPFAALRPVYGQAVSV